MHKWRIKPEWDERWQRERDELDARWPARRKSERKPYRWTCADHDVKEE